ncbi:hypothetical protein HRbin15_00445 [bacterium HR15]|nr:hypothetical protein HRbin15_00445 [bacterium HR15]
MSEKHEIIQIFLDEYPAHLDFLVAEQVCDEPWIQTSPTTGMILYKVRGVDVALELSLDVRDAVVTAYISLFSEAVKPDVGRVSGGRVVRLLLWDILPVLAQQIPDLAEDFQQWKATWKQYYNRVYRFLKALREPEPEVVRDLFRADAQHLALIMRRYGSSVIEYGQRYWHLTG